MVEVTGIKTVTLSIELKKKQRVPLLAADFTNFNRRRSMSDLESLRREMDRTLRPAGERPDGSTMMTRRVFLHKSAIYGASAAACGLFPCISTIEMAFAQGGAAFTFAWLSDTHL